MRLSIRSFSDPTRLLDIEDIWNTFTNEHSENPLYFSGFVMRFMELRRLSGWTPLVLVISVDKDIVGLLPLMTKTKFGIRFVRFLYTGWLSPDFILEEKYREVGIEVALDFLLKNLRCDLIDLTLPLESPNLQILKQKCRDKKIHFLEYLTKHDSEMGHCIIPIGNSWDEFRNMKGRHWRKRWKEREKRLNQAGSWRIVTIENDGVSDAMSKILDIERASWKEAKRIQRNVEIDPDIPIIWEGVQRASGIAPFDWSVWFLELDNKMIAYEVVFQFKEVAYLVKTSYNERYRRLSPGMYLTNSVIHELFNRRQVRNIDFLTDLPYDQTWTDTRLPRVRVTMTKRVILSALIRAMIATERCLSVTNILRYIVGRPDILRA